MTRHDPARKHALARANGKCDDCQSTVGPLHTYRGPPGFEHPYIAVCRTCRVNHTRGLRSSLMPRLRANTSYRYYADYLASPHWQQLARQARANAGNKCQLCAATADIAVHHITYERLGNELATDLLVLCEPCHNREHRIPS